MGLWERREMGSSAGAMEGITEEGIFFHGV